MSVNGRATENEIDSVPWSGRDVPVAEHDAVGGESRENCSSQSDVFLSPAVMGASYAGAKLADDDME